MLGGDEGIEDVHAFVARESGRILLQDLLDAAHHEWSS